MVRGDHRKFQKHRSACTRTHFSWLRFGTSCKSDTQKSTVFIFTSHKTESAKSAREPRPRGHLAEDALAKQYLKQKSLVMWYQQITKSSTRKVNLKTITDTLSWYKISPLSGYNFIRVKPKLHRRQKKFKKVSQTIKKAQSHTSWIRDEWYLWEIGAQSKRGNVCWTVAIGLGWKRVGWFYGMLLPSAKCSRPPGRWWNSLWTAIWRTIRKTRDSFWDNGWILTDFCTRPVKAPPIWQESFTWNIHRKNTIRGWNLERRFSGCRHWGIGKDGRIRNLSSKNQCKRSFDVTKRENIYMPSSRWHSKIVQKRPRIPRTHSWGGRNLWWVKISVEQVKANRKVLNRQKQKMTLKLLQDFWMIQGDFIYRHHNEPRVQLHVPKEETSLFH